MASCVAHSSPNAMLFFVSKKLTQNLPFSRWFTATLPTVQTASPWVMFPWPPLAAVSPGPIPALLASLQLGRIVWNFRHNHLHTYAMKILQVYLKLCIEKEFQVYEWVPRDGTFQNKIFLGSLHFRCAFTFWANISCVSSLPLSSPNFGWIPPLSNYLFNKENRTLNWKLLSFFLASIFSIFTSCS